MSRFLRQQDVVNQSRLSKTPITVIGAGAIGSFVALGLAKIGAERLTVWDHDTVSDHNISNQWYGPADIGKRKVEALGELVMRMTGIEITGVPLRFDGRAASEITVCAVDSMDARVDIWKQLKPRPQLYVDARMGAEVGNVFSVGPLADWYDSELFPSSEAFRAPCTARSTMYCASGLAAYVTAQVANFVSDRPVKPQFVVDFRNAILM